LEILGPFEGHFLELVEIDYGIGELGHNLTLFWPQLGRAMVGIGLEEAFWFGVKPVQVN